MCLMYKKSPIYQCLNHSVYHNTQGTVYLLMVTALLHGPFPALLMARTYVIKTALQSNDITTFSLQNYLNLHCILWYLNPHDEEVYAPKYRDCSGAAVSEGEHHFVSCNLSIWKFWVFPHNNITECTHIHWWTRNWRSNNIYSKRYNISGYTLSEKVRMCLLLNGLSLAIHYQNVMPAVEILTHALLYVCPRNMRCLSQYM